MFHRLHRLLVLSYWAFWVLVALLLYSHRGLFMPLADYADILWHRTTAAEPRPMITGLVTRVYGGDGFQLRVGSALYNFGLAGVSAPRTNRVATAEAEALSRASVAHLTGWLAGERVRIEPTVTNPATSTGLGLAWVGGTNVNARVLAEGFGRLRREQIRALPVHTQYELISAERRARSAGRGLWAPDAPVLAP
jgi:endonuclease YncB( thermonuclease family)